MHELATPLHKLLHACILSMSMHRDLSTSWFVCDNPFQLRNVLDFVPLDSFHHLQIYSTKKLIDIEVQEGSEFRLEEEASIEEKNNTEVSSSPATHVCLELNDISAADQKSSGSEQANVIEAKCRHQKTFESVLQVAPAQEHFERKLSKTWKQECTTYEDLNRNVPSLSPYGDRSKNFANSGFVKTILQAFRKKLTLDLCGIMNCESPKPNISADSLEIQGSLDENGSPPKEVEVISKDYKGNEAVGEQQQKGESLFITISCHYTCIIIALSKAPVPGYQ